MVRSKGGSCFKIITCGSDTVVNEDGFERIESKGSTGKRGWSFRMRSDRHRELGNATILEDSSIGKRENPEPASIDFCGHTSPTIADKFSGSRTDETIPLSSKVNSKAPDSLVLSENTSEIDPIISKENGSESGSLTITKDAASIDPKMEETSAIVIQAAIRGCLSQKALLKIKSVVKLQAAVRGHLVRSQAVGTLRCVQAVVKMQALVRARRARISLEGSVVDVKLADGFGRNDQNMTPLGKEIKANPSFCCTEKILGNAFACQLLESTPKKKPIHIKCDPLRPDSAWKWLERWMFASSSNCAQPQKPQVNQSNSDQGTKTAAEVISEATDMKSGLRETTIHTDSEDNFAFQLCNPTNSLQRDECQQPQFDGVGLSEADETSSKIYINQTEMPLNVASSESEADGEQPKHSMERIASEQPETEGKKIVIGSRKACNPAFVAAQSKFEELSSPTTSTMLINSTNKNIGVDDLFSPADSETKNTETIMTANSISQDPRNHADGLEVDATLSCSFTLDSPDKPEIRGGEKESESEVAEQVISDLDRINDNPSSLENLDRGYPAFLQPGELEVVHGVDSAVDVDSQQPERSASDVQIRHDMAIDQPADRLSPEGSPRSHVTIPESHGTPSSQVSVKAKRKELNKSDRSQNRKSKSADKRSPSNPNQDPGMRNSMEKLPKESKNGKRRNSFSSVKTDYADQEAGESNNSSLPSYMQATESARAKAQANHSPKSSPDVQDNDLYIKKRHSLPTVNGKQGSPRMPSSLPQAQQITKGDNPSRERWQR